MLLVVYLFCRGGADIPLNQVIVLDFLVLWWLTIRLSFTVTGEFAARGDHEARGVHGHSGVHRPGDRGHCDEDTVIVGDCEERGGRTVFDWSGSGRGRRQPDHGDDS